MATAEENARGNARKPRRGGTNGGSENKTGRLGQAFSTGNAPQMDWADVDPRHIVWVLVAVTALGGAVTFGRSRDCGALMVALLLDGERETKWISPRDAPEDVLTEIAEKLEAMR